VPVDFVVEALARLSAGGRFAREDYHLTDPHPHGPMEIARMVADGSANDSSTSRCPCASPRPPLRPPRCADSSEWPAEALDYFDDAARHDATEATADLRALGLECPSFADYVPRLVDFYLRQRNEVRSEAMI